MLEGENDRALAYIQTRYIDEIRQTCVGTCSFRTSPPCHRSLSSFLQRFNTYLLIDIKDHEAVSLLPIFIHLSHEDLTL